MNLLACDFQHWCLTDVIRRSKLPQGHSRMYNGNCMQLKKINIIVKSMNEGLSSFWRQSSEWARDPQIPS